MLAKKMKESIERAMRSDLGPQVHEESSEPGSFRLRMCWNEEARNWTSSIQPCDIIEGCTMATRQFYTFNHIEHHLAIMSSSNHPQAYQEQLTSSVEETHLSIINSSPRHQKRRTAQHQKFCYHPAASQFLLPPPEFPLHSTHSIVWSYWHGRVQASHLCSYA